MATYAIGDVQGCFTQLQALLQHIKFRPKSDKLWFAGDLVNRGPDSLATLRFIKSLGDGAVMVLGNHDLHFLALAEGVIAPKTNDNTLLPLLQAPDVLELAAWLSQQKLLYHDPKLNYVLVHAGLVPQWDLELAKSCAREVEKVLAGPLRREFLSQMYGNTPDLWQAGLSGIERWRFITNVLTRIRFCDEMGRLDLMTKEAEGMALLGYQPWFKIAWRKSLELRILFGHWAALKGNVQAENVFALDGGCVWGGCLIAMRLEDGQRFSIPCR